jgi:hypothetical protein
MDRPAKIHGLTFDVPECICSMKDFRGFGVCRDTSFLPGSDKADKPPPLPIHVMGPTLPTLDFIAYRPVGKTQYCLLQHH